VIHQTGVKKLEQAKANYAELKVDAKVEAFIDDMQSVYRWADIVICRAGAMTIFELASAGVASILVPYPHAVDDHQTENARYLENAGAAIIRQQNELTADWIVKRLREFHEDRPRLRAMARSARSLAIPDSARVIADQCMTAGGITS
jgi:UDP-N-acetylglucosamine--N-acetylmuramyl-(pentapeptide) pyrophosphoryl-undecaprenol N-acetylglucosamine transferase